jgi:hypothetical protein
MSERLERIRRQLGALDIADLQTLHDDIAALLSATQDSPSDTLPQGHIELKMINGYGPYKYLRRVENGKLRSIYLGRASTGDVQRYSPKRRRKKTSSDG